MDPASSNTLLDYSLNTLPQPLQASPQQGNIVYGALSFVVSNGGTTVVNLSQLQFTIPVGALAQELTSDPGAILWATSPSTLWNVTMSSPGVFLLVPQSGQPIPVSADGMVIQFYNVPVNQQVGTVSITVGETASDTGNPSQVRTAIFSVAKFPYGFYFGNFTAQVPLVQNGNSVTLTWQGSDNATYAMQWSQEPPVDVSNVRSWVSPALTNATTFLLRATIVSQGETVTSDLSTTVIVANPEIQATSLQVTGVSNLQGATTIGTGATQATVNGNLTVSGTTQLNGNTTLTNLTTANNVTVNGTLSSSSASTFNNVTINGTMAAMKGAQGVGQGTYTARTDGILVSYASSGGAPPGNKCSGYIIVGMPYGTYWLNGGNYSAPGFSCNGGGVMSLPLPAGQSCSVRFQNTNGNQNNPAYNVAFLPLGSISQGGQMLVKVSDDVPDVGLPAQPDQGSARAESVADAILDAVKSGDKSSLVEALKDILSGR